MRARSSARRRGEPPVPAALVDAVQDALTQVDEAREHLEQVLGTRPGLTERRRAHAGLRLAYLDADALLREATREAKAHSFREWSRWRRRLSQLDTARQQHLFQEADDTGLRPVGSVRAIDTGMSGPSIGEHQHGECSPAGKAATYGLDLDAALSALDPRSPAADARPDRSAVPADVVDLPRPGGTGSAASRPEVA